MYLWGVTQRLALVAGVFAMSSENPQLPPVLLLDELLFIVAFVVSREVKPRVELNPGVDAELLLPIVDELFPPGVLMPELAGGGIVKLELDEGCPEPCAGTWL